VRLVEELSREPKLVQRLRELEIPSSTYYGWKRRLAARGIKAFIAESSTPKRVCNRLSQAERDLIESEARKHEELIRTARPSPASRGGAFHGRGSIQRRLYI